MNDSPAIESADEKLTGGKVGLAKFRATEAEFRAFRVGKELPSTRVTDEVAAALSHALRLQAELERDHEPGRARRDSRQVEAGAAARPADMAGSRAAAGLDCTRCSWP